MNQATQNLQIPNQTHNTSSDKIAIYLDREVVENAMTSLLASFDALYVVAAEHGVVEGPNTSAFDWTLGAARDLANLIDREIDWNAGPEPVTNGGCAPTNSKIPDASTKAKDAEYELEGILVSIEGAVELLDQMDEHLNLDYQQTIKRSCLFSSLRTNLKKANQVMGFLLPDEALGGRPNWDTIATDTPAQSDPPNGAADGDEVGAD